MSNSRIATIDRQISAGIRHRRFEPLSDRQMKGLVGGRTLSANTAGGSRSLPAARHFDVVVGVDVHIIIPGK